MLEIIKIRYYFRLMNAGKYINLYCERDITFIKDVFSLIYDVFCLIKCLDQIIF